MNKIDPIKFDTEELIEELCVTLRSVGVWEHNLPEDNMAVQFIKYTKELYSEIVKRGLDINKRIKILSEETSWDMEELLKLTLTFPKTIPYVREKDGIRRHFRCGLCKKNEAPKRDWFSICNSCVENTINSIKTKNPIDGIILFKTYNKKLFCKHANSETIMASMDGYEDGFSYPLWCEKCLIEEKLIREKSAT